jgi:hypothetical protein
MRTTLSLYLIGLMNLAATCFADDGNTLATATTIVPGTISASLTSGDVDWFKFTVDSVGMVAIYTEGPVDTRGLVCNSAGVSALYGGTFGNGDNNGHNYNFLIVHKVFPGTYYLQVNTGWTGSQTGDYSLTLRTQESSPVITGSSFSGTLTAGQIDFVRIPVESIGLYEFYTTGSIDTYASLYDQAGSYLYIGDDNNGAANNFHIYEQDLDPGEVLMVIGSRGIGAQASPYEGHVLRPSLAEPIGEGSHARSLSPIGDVDHFLFIMPARGEVRVWTTGTTDTDGSIYNSVGRNPYFVNDISASDRNFSMTRTLDPGIYYVRVRAGAYGNPTGNYQLHLDLPGGPFVANAPNTSVQRELAIAQRQLKAARSPGAKKKLKRKIASLLRRIAGL